LPPYTWVNRPLGTEGSPTPRPKRSVAWQRALPGFYWRETVRLPTFTSSKDPLLTEIPVESII